MDLLKSYKNKSRISGAVYIGLNIGLAIALFLAIYLGESAWLAVIILLVSKWRILAVRPRFWYANLVANMVDIIVGLSVIVFMSTAIEHPMAQLVIMGLFIIWLLFIKPQSRRTMVSVQAGVAIFFGITALSMVSYDWPDFGFVIAMWVIGYVSSRHVLGSYEEPETRFLSAMAGLFFAEIGWVGYHWLIGYDVLGIGDLKLSQLAIFVTLLSFVVERFYNSYHRHGKVRRVDVLPPVVLTIFAIFTTFIFAFIFGSDAL